MTWCTYVVGLGEIERRPGVQRGLAVPNQELWLVPRSSEKLTVFRGFWHSRGGR